MSELLTNIYKGFICSPPVNKVLEWLYPGESYYTFQQRDIGALIVMVAAAAFIAIIVLLIIAISNGSAKKKIRKQMKDLEKEHKERERREVESRVVVNDDLKELLSFIDDRKNMDNSSDVLEKILQSSARSDKIKMIEKEQERLLEEQPWLRAEEDR